MKITELFDSAEVSRLLAEREIREAIHPDGQTRMWWSTQEVPSCETAAQINGIVFRNGEILARGIRKFWEVNTEEFPETKLSNLTGLGLRKAVCTRFIDGYPGVVYRNGHGIPMLAGLKGSFTGQPWIWACGRYRSRYQRSEWPLDYCPNVVVVHPDWTRTIKYAEPQIYLTGLVHLGTGDEVPWADVTQWAGYNDIRAVDVVKGNPYDMLHQNLDDRGVVCRWDFGTQTFRVAILTERYKQRAVIEGLHPTDIAEMLEKELDLEPLKQAGDKKFIQWLDNWVLRLHTRYWTAENRCVEILALADEIVPPVSMEEHKELIDFFQKNCNGDYWTLPILSRWLADVPYTDLLWMETKKICEGEEGWRA